MATTVTKTVKPSGGDYGTLSAWEAGQQGDLVAADEIRVAECYAMSDTTRLVIDGWTTDATRYIKITVPAAERHDGKYNTAKYRMEVSSDVTLSYYEAHILVEGVQFQSTSSSGNYRTVYDLVGEAGWFEFRECIFKGVLSSTAAPTAAVDIRTGGQTVYFRNCLFYDFINGTNDIAGIINVSATQYVYNCTFQNSYKGIYVFGGTTVAKNCLAQSCTDGYNGSFTSSTYNCSDITSDAPGTNPVTGSVTFVDAANDDFHLASGDTVAKDAGTDLSADANLAFSIDIDGVTRTGSWDIGADEYVAAGGSANTYYYQQNQ